MKMTELLTHWGNLKAQESKLKAALVDVREEIGKAMHRKKSTEEIITDNNEVNWSVTYQEKSRKSVDYGLLSEILSEEDFDEIVSVSTGTSLVIRKSKVKKKKTKDVTNSAPKGVKLSVKDIDVTKKAPRGKIE